MYFWRIKPLREDLINDRVAQREKMKYLLAWTIYNVVAVQNALWTREAVTLFTIFKAGLVLGINVVGVLACYRANRSGDDADFIDRFICMSWPIIVRLVVIIIGGTALVLTTKDLFGVCAIPYLETVGDGTTLEVFLITIIGEIVYFLWVRGEIAKISRRIKSTEVTSAEGD